MNKKRVLIVKLSSLGDVIFNLPLANTFKQNGYEVTWITSEKGFDIVNNNPLVDEAILAPLKEWKKHSWFENFPEYFKILKYLRSKNFDVAIDSQGLLKSFIWLAFCGAKKRVASVSAREFSMLGANVWIEPISTDFESHAVKNYLKYAKNLNLEIPEIKADLPPATSEIICKIDELFSNLDKTKPIVAIAPATTWTPKHWNKDNWKNLVQKLEDKYTLIFTGTENDKELINYISGGKHLSVAGKTNLLELAEVFRRSDLLISLDSGSTHLAWASGKPKIVTIFCCTPPAMYTPIGDKSKYISFGGNLPCQPCHKRHCPKKENKNACTMLPTVDEVYNGVITLLESK